jgi:hypothetical protein
LRTLPWRRLRVPYEIPSLITPVDGLCALCGGPAVTYPLALVALCGSHVTSLDVVIGMGFLPKDYFQAVSGGGMTDAVG